MPLSPTLVTELKEVLQAWYQINKDGCWIWKGALSKGYGHSSLLKPLGEIMAHRVAYILYRGSIPKGLFVLHSCDIRACINPDHLFLGTQKDNQQDAVSKGRNSRGMINGNSVFTDEQVMEIREKYNLGKKLYGNRKGVNPYTLTKLAREYSVVVSTIHTIVVGKNWKHVA